MTTIESTRTKAFVHELFPTLVFQRDVAIDDDVLERGKTFLRGLVGEELSEGTRFTADRASQTLHHEVGFREVLAIVADELEHIFYDDLNFSRSMTTFYIGRCWPVVQMNRTEGSTHFHAGAVYSGVFFLQAPAGSGGLEFIRPHATVSDHLYRTGYSDLTAPTKAFPVAAKQLWLFNGELWHRALPNADHMTDPRIAVAFDIYTSTDLRNRSGGLPHHEHLVPLAAICGSD